ncbi:hypothetical protein LWI28_021987 [Acer negundo]|uniref:Fucosyltransferase n=1 Tax=Acer negundo TaxID=4023 RepID=A0AAD5IK38_ACENE|nr:hypothetical protein LWI28_021987 [Acer negundo]
MMVYKEPILLNSSNNMPTVASAFLYALLTNRILLIEQKPDKVDLFCEPFPNNSWLLPMNFPFRLNFSSFDQEYENSHGNWELIEEKCHKFFFIKRVETVISVSPFST